VNRNRLIATATAVVLLAAIGIVVRFRPKPEVESTFRVEAAQFIRNVTADGVLKPVKATPISAPREAPGPMKVAWIAEDGTLVRTGDVVVRFDPTEFEEQLTGGNEARSVAGNKLRGAESESATTKTNLRRDAKQAGSELEAAKRYKYDDAEVFSRYQRIESDVDEKLAGNRKEYAEEVLGVRETLARTERELLGIEDRKAGLRITNAEKGLKALEIIAPHDGILVLQRDWRGEIPRAGATVWGGSPIGEIPELNAMKAEVFVLEADAAGIAVDQVAGVTLESRPGVVFRGKVSQIDKLARPRMRGVPVQYFGVTVTLDRTDVAVMKPGARVRAVLEVENRARAFAVPRQALFEKDGKKIAYRKRGGSFQPVKVEISSSSAGKVVVTRGLMQGDEIAMHDPTIAPEEKPDEDPE